MYLLYIDDSGTCQLKHDQQCFYDGGNTRYFVLGALLIKANELNRVEPIIIEEIKDKCFKDQLSEIKNSIKNQHFNCSISCSKETDKYCYKFKVANLIKETDCVIFSCMQDKYTTTKNEVVKSKTDIYKLSFEHLIKLVDTYMYNNKIKEDVIVFIDKKDSGTANDELIYFAYKEALKNKKLYKAFNNTIFSPGINVVYSRYTIGCQLADFIAGSIWTFYESKDDADRLEKIKNITSILGKKVYRDSKDKVLSFANCKEWLK